MFGDPTALDAGFDGCDGCAPPGSSSSGVPSQALGEACVTSIDCGGGLECGYDPTQGCSAGGTCVAQISGGEAPAACGCDGLPVQYVAPGFTSDPVASPYPCGEDGGSGDAATDAASANDAPDAFDAGDAGYTPDAGDAGEDG